MIARLAALCLIPLVLPASAQDQQARVAQTHPYELTAADAAAINLRRPADWIPYRVSDSDVYAIDGYGLIHIPTLAPADPYSGVETVFLEDLEPRATQ